MNKKLSLIAASIAAVFGTAGLAAPMAFAADRPAASDSVTAPNSAAYGLVSAWSAGQSVNDYATANGLDANETSTKVTSDVLSLLNRWHANGSISDTEEAAFEKALPSVVSGLVKWTPVSTTYPVELELAAAVANTTPPTSTITLSAFGKIAGLSSDQVTLTALVAEVAQLETASLAVAPDSTTVAAPTIADYDVLPALAHWIVAS